MVCWEDYKGSCKTHKLTTFLKKCLAHTEASVWAIIIRRGDISGPSHTSTLPPIFFYLSNSSLQEVLLFDWSESTVLIEAIVSLVRQIPAWNVMWCSSEVFTVFLYLHLLPEGKWLEKRVCQLYHIRERVKVGNKKTCLNLVVSPRDS